MVYSVPIGLTDKTISQMLITSSKSAIWTYLFNFLTTKIIFQTKKMLLYPVILKN
jgi:hypothetical protein